MSLTRRQFIERTLRQVYGGMPSDDATITPNLVNTWLNDAIGLAAKANYKDNLAIDGISYVNSSFYTKFSRISVTSDSSFVWKLTLPQMPIGIGANEGISTIELRDSDGNISLPLIPITESQKSYYRSMRPIPNKVLYYYEGNLLYMISTMMLSSYTANVVMVSGGDDTNLDSVLNVPPDYFNIMAEYIKQQLMAERSVPVDESNDGSDFIQTT